jgi:hypothetical protein
VCDGRHGFTAASSLEISKQSGGKLAANVCKRVAIEEQEWRLTMAMAEKSQDFVEGQD